MLPALVLTPAPFSTNIFPAAPDQVVVPPAFKVRLERTTLAEAGKLKPAFALTVAFVPFMQDVPLSDEQMNPPDQFSGVEKFRIPGADPARVPFVKFTVVAEMVVVPVPKSIVAPMKFTVPVPLIGPPCANMFPAKLIVPPVLAV